MGNKSKQFPEMEETGQIISEVIKSGKSADIVVESDSFAEGLVEERDSTKKLFGKITVKTPYIRVLRFVLVMTALVMSVTFILHYSIVYIRDILFYKNELEVNSMGAFTPRTGTGTEYGVFLFNTAELWANSGIRISKGDEVSISMSGAFHSSFADLIHDADKNNSSPAIRWIGMSEKESKTHLFKKIQQWCCPPKKDSTTNKASIAKADLQYYLYNQWYQKANGRYGSRRGKDKPTVPDSVHFGAVLCAIAPEYFSGDPLDSLLDIHVLNGERFKAKSSGVLRFAVNDIYFENKERLNSYAQENPTRHGKEFNVDSINTDCESFRTMFYDDNVGQLLACVEIQHPLKMKLLNPMSAYRELDKAVREFAEESFPNNIQPLGNCILWFLGFVLWIMLICAVWTIIAFAIITAVYWIAIAIGKGVGKLKSLSGN